MSDLKMTDVTGTPRPREDIAAAIKCIENEMVRNPIAMAKDDSPLLIHYTVIRDALYELLKLRANLAAWEGARVIK